MPLFTTDTVGQAESLIVLAGSYVREGVHKGQYVSASVANAETDVEALDEMYKVGRELAKAFDRMT